MQNQKLINLFGLARELNLPVAWLKSEALAGRIPCLRIGHRLRFNKEAVESALSKRARMGEVNEQ
jgi:hypothetical protein